MMEFVSWDDDIPNCMESYNPLMFQTTNQWNFRKVGVCAAWDEDDEAAVLGFDVRLVILFQRAQQFLQRFAFRKTTA